MLAAQSVVNKLVGIKCKMYLAMKPCVKVVAAALFHWGNTLL